MTNINDLFGRQPGAPDGEDFWRLSEVLLAMDGGAEDDLGPRERTGYEDETIRHVAYQRALRFITNIRGVDPESALAVMWIDGFVAGVMAGKFDQGGE